MIPRSVSFASFSVSRAMMKPLRPNLTSQPASRVRRALNESQANTIGVAAMPLNRDAVTDV